MGAADARRTFAAVTQRRVIGNGQGARRAFVETQANGRRALPSLDDGADRKSDPHRKELFPRKKTPVTNAAVQRRPDYCTTGKYENFGII